MSIAEPLRETIDLLGIDLFFPTFDLKALPGYTSTMMYKGETSLYEVRKMLFSFMILTSDVAENNIKEGDAFTLEDGTYLHTFKCSNTPVPDMTGWSNLMATWEGKVSV